MNLFRPYRNDEPQRDERGRLMGIDRYQDVPAATGSGSSFPA